MQILKDVTEGISPLNWSTGGFKQGELMIISGGRRLGKSNISMHMKLLKNRIYDTNLCKEILLPMRPEPEYKFSRANWYVAEYNWTDQIEVYEWCTQQFGPHPMYPDAWSRWYNKYNEKIHFRDTKDYEWFMLRWS